MALLHVYSNDTFNHGPLLQSNGMRSFIAVLFILTSSLMVVSNIFCLIVLHRTRVLEEPTKVFMISLNAADLTCGLVVSIPMTTEWILGRWPFGRFLCSIYASFGMDLFAVSVLSALLLTIDRYTAIYYPLRYPSLMTLTRARVMACCNWGVNMISMAIILIILHSAVKDATIYVTSERYDHQCYFKYQSTKYYGVCSIIMVSIPTIIITILYIKIVLTALKHAKRIDHEAQLGNQAGGNQLCGNRQNRSKRKSLTTAVIITASLYICFLPDMVVVILVNFLDITVSTEIEGLTSIIYCSNSWLNVIIYLFRHKELQKEAKALLKCPCRKH